MEGINPLTIPVENNEKIVVSGSMTDFSFLASHYPLKQVIDVVDQFLEICSISFIEYGGQVVKYSGGCVVGYFEKNQLNEAIAASKDTYKKFNLLCQPYSHYMNVTCGFGLAYGEMIQGNIGSSIKMDYTVLGNTVDQAIRLSIIARNMNKAIAVNESIKGMTNESWSFEYCEDLSDKDSNEIKQVYSLVGDSNSG
jgi:class 3 adenylate cyclase